MRGGCRSVADLRPLARLRAAERPASSPAVWTNASGPAGTRPTSAFSSACGSLRVVHLCRWASSGAAVRSVWIETLACSQEPCRVDSIEADRRLRDVTRHEAPAQAEVTLTGRSSAVKEPGHNGNPFSQWAGVPPCTYTRPPHPYAPHRGAPGTTLGTRGGRYHGWRGAAT